MLRRDARRLVEGLDLRAGEVLGYSPCGLSADARARGNVTLDSVESDGSITTTVRPESLNAFVMRSRDASKGVICGASEVGADCKGGSLTKLAAIADSSSGLHQVGGVDCNDRCGFEVRNGAVTGEGDAGRSGEGAVDSGLLSGVFVDIVLLLGAR